MLTVEQQKVEFEPRLTAWLAGAQKIITDKYTKDNYGPKETGGNGLIIPQLSMERGKKYIKIVRTDSQRSVHCFIDMTNGDVLKAATWKAPARTARGNLFDATGGLGSMGIYGPAYLNSRG